MDAQEPPRPVEGASEPEFGRPRPLQRLFLLDVVRDRDSRPAILWALSTLLVGMFFYHWAEGWSYLDSLYFCVVSLATVGYGDLTPTTPIARVFTMVYLVNGIVILLALFDRIRSVRTERIRTLAAQRRQG
jgi:hypothetical protein